MQTSFDYHDANSQAVNLLTQCCQAGHLSTSQPLYTNGEQSRLLINYIQAALRTFETKQANEPKSQFDARIRAQRVEQNNLKRNFIAQFAKDVVCDELEEPVIFTLIQNQLKVVEKQLKIKRIQQIFPYSNNDLQNLSIVKFQQLYVKTENVLQQIEAVQNVISTLCERAELPSSLISVAYEFNLSTKDNNLSSGIDPLDYLSFLLIAPNEGFGYSIYNMLVIADIVPNEPFEGSQSECYEDAMEFKLNYNQFSILQRDLGDLIKWYRDFENVLSGLFAADVARYVKTGCKPLIEAVRTELGRQKAGMKPLISESVQHRFSQHGHELFLLFGQCAIDLTMHPHPDDMRDLFIEAYKRCNLKDSKNEDKTFVRGPDGELTYRSLLNVTQIRAIYHEIMALSALSQAAHDMGLPSIFTYIEVMCASRIDEVYFASLQEMLIEAFLSITPDQNMRSISAKRQYLKHHMTRLFPAPDASQSESFSSMQQRYHVAIQNFLNQTMNIRLSPIMAQSNLIPTEQEKMALLSSSPQSTMPFVISTNVQLDYTVAVLKNSPNYPTLAKAYAEYYSELGAQAKVNGMTTYDPKLIYMYPTLDECLDTLLSEFKRRTNAGLLLPAKQAWLSIVMKIVYAEKMRIPEAALQRIAKRFGDIFKVDNGRDDLSMGCTTGFAGRFLVLESQLVPGEDNPFLQFIKQLLIDAMEQSFNDTIGSIQQGESSMAALIKPVIMEVLGLVPTNDRLYTDTLHNDLSKFMRDLATRYNPGKIYDQCYQYFCDEFKSCVREGDDDRMQSLLTLLGFLDTDHSQLQIDGKWNINRFEVFLPKKTLVLLTKLNIIFKEPFQPGSLIIEARSSSYSFIDCIAKKQQALETAQTQRRPASQTTNSNSQSRPAQNQTPATPAVTSGWLGWISGGLFSSSATTTTPTNNNINGYSNRSNGAGPGSSG